jgi:hypothetical protein
VNGRRQLDQLLDEMADAALVAARGAPGMRARRLEITLPIELTTGTRDGKAVLFGDVPRTRLLCDFDLPPSRLVVVWEETSTP